MVGILLLDLEVQGLAVGLIIIEILAISKVIGYKFWVRGSIRL